MTFRQALTRLLLPAAALLSAGAQAHDTWFEPMVPARPNEIRLRLGTGNQFPKLETSPGGAAFDTLGCRAHGAPAGQRPATLRRGRDDGAALELSASWPRRTHGVSATCWAQLAPFEIEVAPALVEVYFKEIAAPPAVRETWAALKARGLPFAERYTKHARWERFDADTNSATSDTTGPIPAPLGMDIVIETRQGPPRRGQRLAFTVLRDGRPLPGQAIEARSALSPIGLWLRTDAQGRAETPLPLAGRWLLRGTDLRLSDILPDTWESRFITVAFDALP